ncbi:Fusaric acid resistance protein-like-domain-containing protein [Tirmania nivea]|nr:Fusaric acid resistance protein-like-domain-containing protein [Tirmania nivea]
MPSSSSGRGFFKPPRKTSVIVPFTAERVHVGDYGSRGRNLTLRIPSLNVIEAQSPANDTSPLLGRSYASYAPSEIGRTQEEGDENDFERRWSWKWVGKKVGMVKEVLGSKNTKMVTKCTIAYFLGSLATFVTPIAEFLGKSDGKHMVATIAVYFHPARTQGSMFEAIMYAFAALFYSTFISVASMYTAEFFGNIEMLGLGHAVILIVFCAGGLGFIGWVKQAMASPTVATACSLAAISCITILTREGSVQAGHFSWSKILQVTTMLFMAITASTAVALTLWPSSAADELRKSMVKSTDSFSTLLSIITKSFLTGSEDMLSLSTYLEACKGHRLVFTSMSKQLMEAKYEHYVKGTEKQYRLESKLVDCMQKLAQHIGGLQSASKSQMKLLREQPDVFTPYPPIPTPYSGVGSGPSTIFSPPNFHQFPMFASNTAPTPSMESANNDFMTASFHEQPETPVGIFEQFIYHLGPPMKSLVITLQDMLDNLSSSPGDDLTIAVNPLFRESLVKATALYYETREKALNNLYKNLRSITGSKDQKQEWAADVEEVAGCCGYFSYCLHAISQDMAVFLDILEQMEYYQNHKTRSWDWLKIWRRFGIGGGKLARRGSEDAIPQAKLPDMLKPLAHTKTLPNMVQDHPVPFSYRIWKALKVFRRNDVKFGIKVGGGAALFALPAFLESTRPMFSHWRGEWGLVSYMIVMSMTIGQTNSSGLLRVLGTIIGAALAVLAWIIFPMNPYALSLFGCIIAMPCFHIILNWKQNTFGRFIILTYNLSCLYAYSLSAKDNDHDDDEGGKNPSITEIAFHRFVSVVVGVAWGIFINRYIWPISARSKLRKGFSVLWFRMALIWKRDPLLSTMPHTHTAITSTTTTTFSSPHEPKKYMSITEERALQRALLRLSSLTNQAPSEYRLKGPFPTSAYTKLITANQNILDACHGMSMLIASDPLASEREKDILDFTVNERADCCARISHLFYILASSIRLGFPLPDTLPRLEGARDRLLARLWEYRRERVRGEVVKWEEEFQGVYAYVLVLGRIAEGLGECVEVLNGLYGVLEEEMLEI